MIDGLNNANTVINSKVSSGSSLNSVQNTNNENSGSEQVKEMTRTSRVEEIKRQIELGEYQVNIDKTAQKVAETLLS